MAAEGNWVSGNPNDRSVYGFRVRHGGRKGPMSKTKYFALRKAGLGPQEQFIGGMIRITAEAEAAWDAKMMTPKYAGAAARLAWREARAEQAQARRQRAKDAALAGVQARKKRKGGE